VQIFNKHISRVITLIVALQLLNLSIYAQDFSPIFSNQGNTETNISETVVEFVIEVILGHTGAIPEQSQHHKDLHFHKHVSYKAVSFEKTVLLSDTQINIAKLPITLQESFKDLYQQEINPQPPKI
jgi:hypothetical protein